MTSRSLPSRAAQRGGRGWDALRRAVAFARAGRNAAAGLAAAGSTGRALLSAAGVHRLRLRPHRLHGLTLAIDPRDEGHLCVVEEFFLSDACDLSLIQFDPDMILDCGAHIGVFTLLARQRFPHATIIAFEPDPENVRWLESNLRDNGVSDVAVRTSAVSIADGLAAFHRIANHSESGRMVPSSSGETSGNVPVVNLPALVREIAGSLLLKLDIEGEEERLIPALVDLLPRRCAIFFETHGGNPAWQHASTILRGSGFSISLIRAREAFCDGFAARI